MPKDYFPCLLFGSGTRQLALAKVDSLGNVHQAKSILHRLVDLGYDAILDTILNN